MVGASGGRPAAVPRMKYMPSVRIFLCWLIDIPPAYRNPIGGSFSAPARFDHQGEAWTDSAWSLTIIPEGVPNSRGEQFAVARFLVNDAPHAWLNKERPFTLFEGSFAIATGVVVESDHDPISQG